MPKRNYYQQHLTGLSLDSEDLIGSNFEDSSLLDSEFKTSALTNSRFRNSRLIRCSFIKVNLSAADLGVHPNELNQQAYGFRQDRMVPQRPVEGTILEACKFVECNLNKSYFRRCTLNSVVFTDCDLRQSDFSSTDLSHVEFNNCLMEGTVFSRSVSTEVKFNACNFGKSLVPILKEKK